jgi:hypothetical protein
LSGPNNKNPHAFPFPQKAESLEFRALFSVQDFLGLSVQAAGTAIVPEVIRQQHGMAYTYRRQPGKLPHFKGMSDSREG